MRDFSDGIWFLGTGGVPLGHAGHQDDIVSGGVAGAMSEPGDKFDLID